MTNDFDLKKYLAENKLTTVSKVIESNDDDFTVTPNEKEWNKFEIGDIVTVDWSQVDKNAAFSLSRSLFNNKPFKITVDYGDDYYQVVPADKETKKLWSKEQFWDYAWVDKTSVKPYVGSLNEQDEEWTVTSSDKWNEPDIGSIVTVDTYSPHFDSVPFEIVGEEKGRNYEYWWVEPVREKDKILWRKIYKQFGITTNTWFYTDKALAVRKNEVEPYTGPLNEQDEDDDFTVTPDESHWNEFEVGDEVTVDWDKMGDFDIVGEMTWFHPMKNKPFRIIDKMKDLYYGNIYGIAPVDETDQEKWDYEIGGIWWTVEAALKPYYGSINEENDDEFNVTPDEQQWNVPDIGSIVTVDFEKETANHKELWQFTNVPFKIIGKVEKSESWWWVEPVRAEDKVKWKEVKREWHEEDTFYWTDKKWLAYKENVKPYTESINEQDEDNNEWNVKASDEWNELGIGDIVTVDWKDEGQINGINRINKLMQLNNKPFEIVDEMIYRNDKFSLFKVSPIREEDKQKWAELILPPLAWWALKKNVKPYTG